MELFFFLFYSFFFFLPVYSSIKLLYNYCYFQLTKSIVIGTWQTFSQKTHSYGTGILKCIQNYDFTQRACCSLPKDIDLTCCFQCDILDDWNINVSHYKGSHNWEYHYLEFIHFYLVWDWCCRVGIFPSRS